MVEEKKAAPESPKTSWFGSKDPVVEEKKVAIESPQNGRFSNIVKENEVKSRPVFTFLKEANIFYGRNTM